MLKIMLKKGLNLFVAFVFAVSNTLYAAEIEQSTLRSLSTANMLSRPRFPFLEKAKSSSAGGNVNPAERLNLLKETIAGFLFPGSFRTSAEVEAFLRWVETEATLADIKGLINRISQRGFRLIQQTEQERQRSSAEVDFRKNSDQEEVALLSRIIYAAVHNTNFPKLVVKNFILQRQKEKKISNLFKIAVELARSKVIVDNIKRPLKVAFHFAIYTGKDRMSRQSEHINGEDSLRRKILQLEDLFGDNPLVDWQLIAIDDGSPNDSGKFAESILRNEYSDYYVSGKTKVLYMEDIIKECAGHPILKGLKTTADTQKGGTLEWGMYVSIKEGADILIYTDTDTSSHLGFSGNLLGPIENGKADVVFGSRAMPDSLVLNRPFMRRIKSWQDTEAYSTLVTKPLLPDISDIRDTQNSFKAFRGEVLTHILPFTVDKKLSFDTELLILAKGAGYRIKEIGMPWVDTPARTTVKMRDGLKMAKRIFTQRKRLKSGAYNLEESHRYKRLTLKAKEGEKTFLIIGPLYKDESLLLAEDESTGELFVIKKLLTPEMEEHSSEIGLEMKKIPDDYPYVYKPVFMSAGKHQWAGLEEAWAVVYPYIPGESFKDRFQRTSKGTVGYYGVELLDMVMRIADIAVDLEKMGVPFIWDIKPENIIIKPDDTPVLIDYTIKRRPIAEKLEYLIYGSLRRPEHKDVEDVISCTRFANAGDLDQLIKEKLLEFRSKVKAREFTSIDSFKEELTRLRRFFARCVLKDLIRDWENYDKNKRIIQKLTPDILGIKDPKEFKPIRPVRVIVGAAGLGTRMKSDKPKVLQEVCGEPIIYHVLKETAFLDKRPIVIVRPEEWKDALGNEGTGGSYEAVKEALTEGGFKAEYAFQDYLKGDGNTVYSAKELLADFNGDILVVWGDMAVLNPETVLWLTMVHQALGDVPLSIATAAKEKPYAPILDGENRKVTGSKKGADLPFGRDDVGIFIGDSKDVFKALEQFPRDNKGDFVNPLDGSANKKGEINFVQVSAILAQEGKEVIAPPLADIREFQGVNDFDELRTAELYRKQMEQERRSSSAKSSSAGEVTYAEVSEKVMDAAEKTISEMLRKYHYRKARVADSILYTDVFRAILRNAHSKKDIAGLIEEFCRHITVIIDKRILGYAVNYDTRNPKKPPNFNRGDWKFFTYGEWNQAENVLSKMVNFDQHYYIDKKGKEHPDLALLPRGEAKGYIAWIRRNVKYTQITIGLSESIENITSGSKSSSAGDHPEKIMAEIRAINEAVYRGNPAKGIAGCSEFGLDRDRDAIIWSAINKQANFRTGNNILQIDSKEENGRVIGYIVYGIAPPRVQSFAGDKSVHIYYMATHPQARGRGFGKELFRKAVTFAGQNSIYKITLEVRKDSPYRRFYDKMGRLPEMAGMPEVQDSPFPAPHPQRFYKYTLKPSFVESFLKPPRRGIKSASAGEASDISGITAELTQAKSALVSAEAGKLDAAILDAAVNAYQQAIGKLKALKAESAEKAVSAAEPLRKAEASLSVMTLSRDIAKESASLKDIAGTIVINDAEIPANQKTLLTMLDKESPYLKALEEKLGCRVRLLNQFDLGKDSSANMIAISKAKLDIPKLKYINIKSVIEDAYLPLEQIIVLAKGLLVYNIDKSSTAEWTVGNIYKFLAKRPMKLGLLAAFIEPTGEFLLELPAPVPVDENYYEDLHKQAMAALIAA